MQRHPSGKLHGAARSSNRPPAEYRNRNSFGANGDTTVGAAQIPTTFANGQGRGNGLMGGSQPLDLARSPPSATSNKNTKHVPCKFFKQGACQAGQACPFLHSTDAAIETAPCKYFAKGNCKFGAKCALAHILPDGRRVNRPNGPLGMTMNGGPLNIGGRVNPPTYQHHDSALANSLLTQQQFAADPFSGHYPYPQDEVNFAQEYDARYAPFLGEPGLGSNSVSKYGSPTNDSQLPMSGVERRLTALDAPLPASFDSNGISHIARYGAVAASVPSKFGMESPPASLPQRSTGQPLDAVKALRSSVFPSNLRNSSQLGSSPPAINPEEPVGQRKMHSQQSIQRPRLLSASVPRPGTADDWDHGFTLEEDFLPTTLHDDVLTPQEKMRRLSRPEQDFGGSRNTTTQSGLGIPSGNSSKVGSPLGSSPSRFSALFAKQRQESNNSATGTAFGHVGSPLRESHIQNPADLSPFGDGITARPFPGSRSRSGLVAGDRDQSSLLSSPPRTGGAGGGVECADSTSNFGMSMMASQLQHTHLASTRNDGAEVQHSNSSRLQPPGLGTTGVRHVSAPVVGSGAGRFDRTISSPRINSTRIAEEREGEGDLVFSMDDDTSKRNSSLWGGKSPVMAALGEARNGVPVRAGGSKETRKGAINGRVSVAGGGAGGVETMETIYPNRT